MLPAKPFLSVRCRTSLWACLPMVVWLVCGSATPAVAAKRVVATNGADSGSCGSVPAPCLTINQAIANASPGDTVEVGPGRYGGLAAGCPGFGGNCVVWLDKAVTLVSRDGASSTIIDATGANTGIYLDTSGAVLGSKSKGFTVEGGAVGIFVDSTASGVSVTGNTVLDTSQTGIDFAGAGTVSFNRAIRSGGSGFVYVGSGSAKGNLAAGNAVSGFFLGGTSAFSMTGELASGNAGAGFSVIDSSPLITKSAAIGNGSGVNVTAVVHPTSPSFTKGTILGNSGAGLIIGDAGPGVSAIFTHDYWGAATGPGPAPADNVLDPASEATVTPFAAKEIKVKPVAQR
jgi:hypothetical protein